MNGVELEPWAQAGYRCCAVDTQNSRRVRTFSATSGSASIYMKEGDIRKLPLDFCKGAKMVYAFPPCTDLASSGARWWRGKGHIALVRAAALVARCRVMANMAQSYCLENPVGRLSTYWRKPDHYFHPCDYGGYPDPIGDQYTKKTCLWVG